MSTTETLPSGNTVVIRDPNLVTERQNRQIVKSQVRLMASSPEFTRLITENRESLLVADGDDPSAVSARGAEIMAALGEDGYMASEEINDVLIAVLVESWSYTFPVSAEAAADLPKADYAALKVITAEVGKVLLTAGTDPTPDPASPTQP